MSYDRNYKTRYWNSWNDDDLAKSEAAYQYRFTGFSQRYWLSGWQ
jgi:hypothetical protein